MKLKKNPKRIICFILLEIVLIGALLFVFCIKNANKGSSMTMKTEVKANKNLYLNTHKEQDTSGNFVPNTIKNIYQFKMTQQHNEIFTDFFTKSFSFKNQARDFQIPLEDQIEKKFIATTYDLSYASCGKYQGEPAYGITFSGTKAMKGRTIAVDPNIIPLGSNVYIEFPDQYAYLNGWYLAEDIGSKVKGYIIDVFLGKSEFQGMEKFGSRKVNVKILS